MMAIRPTQVPIINAALTPTAAEIDHATAVVATFEGHPHAGVLQLGGQMIEAPHLKQARSVAAASGRTSLEMDFDSGLLS
jgi:citrate lyase subunit beta / citryl-CoA lyase